ncbi:MAG: uracil-xanthine permease family protein [Eubacteriales bacterium]|nr:uracil-xanthine permease family protein [Eubacteriales bacterium]
MNGFQKINDLLFPGAKTYPKVKIGKALALGFQHAFAMSCATILVPLLTGLDVGVALLAAGLGTLIFHLCTGGKNPVFLGSSFAFITALCAVISSTGEANAFGATQTEQIQVAMWGILAAGFLYLIIAFFIKLCGVKFIDKLFPPVVRGVGIAIIGLNLASAAINNIQNNNGFALYTPGYYWSWALALITCLTAVFLSSYGKGMFKMASIVIALFTGYMLSLIVTLTGVAPQGLMNLSSLQQHAWIELPKVTFPTFDFAARGSQILHAIAIIAPIAIVTMVEHVGDVYANGAVVGRDFVKDPGLHRTMLGDGLATMAAGFLGGPANTTYSENTAVLAATGNYNPMTLRIAAVIAILLSFLGKAIGIVETVPNCVLGGACIVLYGMIASVGLRTLVENHVDFTKNRNLCIAAVMLVLAMGGAVIGGPDFSFSGIGLGIIAGILLNLVMPGGKTVSKPGLVAHSVPDDEIVVEMEKKA